MIWRGEILAIKVEREELGIDVTCEEGSRVAQEFKMKLEGLKLSQANKHENAKDTEGKGDAKNLGSDIETKGERVEVNEKHLPEKALREYNEEGDESSREDKRSPRSSTMQVPIVTPLKE